MSYLLTLIVWLFLGLRHIIDRIIYVDTDYMTPAWDYWTHYVVYITLALGAI